MKNMYGILAAGVLAMVSCSIVLGCGNTINMDDNGKDDNPRVVLRLSEAQRQFVTEGNAFSMNFLDKVAAAESKDFILSPLSMQFLLGMILDGTGGQTAEEIATVLGYGKDEADAVNDYCQTMLRQLPGLDKKTKILIADAIYVDKGFDLKEQYKKTVVKYYDAAVSNLDFSDTKGSASIINDWCSDHTEGLISHILDETSPDMLCYLLNALYFKSGWAVKFNKELTADEKFTRANGSTASVPMMKAHKDLRYGEGTAFRAVRLPYGNGAYSMTVLLPKDGKKLTDVTAELKVSDWKAVEKKMYFSEVDLWLPRFQTQFGINLNDILSDLGMPSAFDPLQADFTPMSEDALCLSFVRQDAVIKVDEEGTEAAAVSSAGIIKNTSVGPSSYVVFHADRPFFYLITEADTGAVLFAGRYGNVK